MKILVVDDAEQTLMRLKKLLEAKGYTVVTARNADEAIAAARKSKGLDLLIADFHMPGLDGLTMFKAIRQLPNFASLPSIFLTTETTAEIKSASRKAGVKAWVVKPFNDESLLNLVQVVLRGNLSTVEAS